MGCYKRLEFELRKALDTPAKMMEILRASRQARLQKERPNQIEVKTHRLKDPRAINLEDLMNSSLPQEDFGKLSKFESLLCGRNSAQLADEELAQQPPLKPAHRALSSSYYIF